MCKKKRKKDCLHFSFKNILPWELQWHQGDLLVFLEGQTHLVVTPRRSRSATLETRMERPPPATEKKNRKMDEILKESDERIWKDMRYFVS